MDNTKTGSAVRRIFQIHELVGQSWACILSRDIDSMGFYGKRYTTEPTRRIEYPIMSAVDSMKLARNKPKTHIPK